MEVGITTDQSSSWTCTISLRRGGVSGAPAIINFSPTLTEKGLVEIWLRRAQAAILNPHRGANEFHGKSVAELRAMSDPETKAFSSDVVVVSLNDPDSTDLSFVDLPGKHRCIIDIVLS